MEQPNILFILIDALRAQNLGCYGYSKPVSPNIDQLAKEGVLFKNAFSCTITTYPSLTSIFSGEYPLTHGVKTIQPTVLSRQNIESLHTRGTVFLPELLKSESYTTMAVDWLGRWLKRGYDYYSGVTAPKGLKTFRLLKELALEPIRAKPMRRVKAFIDKWNLYNTFATKFTASAKFTAKAKTIPIRHAGAMTQKAINLMRRCNGNKFFLFIHYWDTHTPYTPPGPYTEKFLKYEYEDDQPIEKLLKSLTPSGSWFMQKRLPEGIQSVKEVLARYDGAVAYVDREISKLVKTLEELGISDNTLVIVTSDHGESLTEHEIHFAHHGLYETTTHVPLIFRYSGFPKTTIESLVQHSDVTPTILDMLGIDSSSLELDGKSALPLIYGKVDKIRNAVLLEEDDVERKRAIRTERYKYITALSKEDAMCRECRRVHGGVEELYDLKVDSEENHSLIEEKESEAKILKQELSDWVQLLESKRGKRSTRRIEKARVDYSVEEEKLIAKKLKELGYM